MNVAYHLSKQGIESCLISRVGNDKEGNELLTNLEKLGLSTQYCQVDPNYPTSIVEAETGPDNEMKYEISSPVAWDYIEYEEQYAGLVQNSAALVFGSLALRNKVSRRTLSKLLDGGVYAAFDVNLREPFYKRDIVSRLLGKTDFLKLNIHELSIIAEWFKPVYKDEWNRIHFLLEKFSIKEAIVTRGKNGSSYYSAEVQCHAPACKVKEKNTIGSGDAFLAGFISKRLKHKTIKEALDFASAVGAFVTTKSGACPIYTNKDLEKFHKINES
jgi:fructokinase